MIDVPANNCDNTTNFFNELNISCTPMLAQTRESTVKQTPASGDNAQALDDSEAAKYPFVAFRNGDPTTGEMTQLIPALAFPLDKNRSLVILPYIVNERGPNDLLNWYVHEGLDEKSPAKQVKSNTISWPMVRHQHGQTRFEIDYRNVPKLDPASESSFPSDREVTILMAVPRDGIVRHVPRD